MIYIGADHHGFEMKAKLNQWMKGRGYTFEDLGAYKYDAWDDYTDFAIDVAERVAENPNKNWGILICGSGVGMCVAANKVRGVRAGLGFEVDQIHAARKDDNMNVLVLAADNTDEMQAISIAAKFFETEFVESDKYLRRLEKISRFESSAAHEINKRH